MLIRRSYGVKWYTKPTKSKIGRVSIRSNAGVLFYLIEPLLSNNKLEGFRIHREDKRQIYNILWLNNKLNCSCPAFSPKIDCKHVLTIKTLGLHK